MALTHIVDTSVLTRLRLESVREAIEPRASAGELARAAISDLEVGYSVRGAKEWDRLMEALGIFELIETTAAHMDRARQVQRMLAARHQRGRKIPDLLVAAAAEANRLSVLHYDADFDAPRVVIERDDSGGALLFGEEGVVAVPRSDVEHAPS